MMLTKRFQKLLKFPKLVIKSAAFWGEGRVLKASLVLTA